MAEGLDSTSSDDWFAEVENRRVRALPHAAERRPSDDRDPYASRPVSAHVPAASPAYSPVVANRRLPLHGGGRPASPLRPSAPLSAGRANVGVPVRSPRGSAGQEDLERDPSVLLRRLPLFQHVPNLNHFVQALKGCLQRRHVAQGDFVFRHGQSGAEMFIVLSGRVELSSRDGRVLAVLEPGNQFGEIAMLYGGERNASARAATPCRLASLSRADLSHAMDQHRCRDNIMVNAQHIPYVKQWFIAKVPLFQTCAHVEAFIDKVADALQYRGVSPRQTVIREGDIGLEMYFLVAGQVDVRTGGRKITTLSDGSYFGEIAMLFGESRTATITAVNTCHLYALSKADFERILEDHHECIDLIYGSAQETQVLKEHFIRKIPLFADVRNNPEFVLNMSLALSSVSFRPGEYIIREDDEGHEMFFIARGDVKVLKGGEQVAALQAGSFFGEVSLVYDERRTASVQAVHYCHMYSLMQEAFETIAAAFPAWWRSITTGGNNLLQRVSGSKPITSTRFHNLSVPEVNNPEAPPPRPRSGQPVHESVVDREGIRRRLQQQGARPPPVALSAEEKLQELLDQKLCCICADKEKCMLFVPCGHVSSCEDCAPQLRTCPQCRAPVQQRIKAHF